MVNTLFLENFCVISFHLFFFSDGVEVLKKIESQPTQDDRPLKDVIISDCGIQKNK
jgi:hypothetical protein